MISRRAPSILITFSIALLLFPLPLANVPTPAVVAVQQQAEDIIGTYGGLTSGSASNCTNPLDNGFYLTDINIRLNQPVVNGQGVRTVTGVVTLAGAGPNFEDVILSLQANLSAPGDTRTLSNGTVGVLFPSSLSGSGTFTGQWLRGSGGASDQLQLNYAAQGSAFGQGCVLTGSVSTNRLGAPPVITFSPGILTHPLGSLDPQVQVTQQNGVFQIVPRANVAGLHYNGFISDQFINVSNFNVGVEAKQTATGGAETVFALAEDSDNFFRFVKVDGNAAVITQPEKRHVTPDRPLDDNASFLLFQVRVKGILSTFYVPYNAVLHRHWRFRYEPIANTINFETSPDQVVWTVQNRVTLTRSVSALTAELSAGTATSVNNPSQAIFQNFNLSTTPPVTASPLDDPLFFVRAHYYDFLNRDPDPAGLAFWADQITSCPPADQACINARRIRVSNSFFFEQEFQQTGAYVFRLYRAAYGNHQPFPNPDVNPNFPGEAQKLPSYAAFSPDRARVIGGSNLAQSQLELANAFVSRPEFLNKYPANLDGPAFIAAVLNTIRTDSGPDLSNQQSALLTLYNQAQGGGRGGVMYRLADDNQTTNPINNRSFIDAEYRRAFVTTEYFGYLRRDADINGLLFWLGQVNRFPLRNADIQNAMVCSFVTSAEFQQRFNLIVTHTNAECPQ